MAKKDKNRKKQVAKKALKEKAWQARIKKIEAGQAKPPPKRPSAGWEKQVEASVERAMGMVDKGEAEQAKKVMVSLQKKYPKNPHVSYGRGVIAAMEERLDDSVQHFADAVRMNPNFLEAYFNQAIAYQKQEKLYEMILAYHKVLELGPPGHPAVLQAEKVIKGVEENIQEELGLSLEEYTGSHHHFKQAIAHVREEQWEAASGSLQKSIDINNKNPQAYGNLGLCYANLGKKEMALKALNAAIALDLNYEPALVNRKKVEAMEEGVPLGTGKVRGVDYYKDYSQQKKSFIREVLDTQKTD